MEEKIQKNENKKAISGIIAVVVIVIIVVGGYLGFNSYKDSTQKNLLNEELTVLSKKTLGKDDFNTEIKTSGDYSKVEKTVKEYLQKYSDTIKSISEESAKIANMQGVVKKDKLDGRKKDVKEIKTKVEKNINTLIEMSSEENIKKAIEKEGLSTKYVDMYNEVMIGNLSKKLEKQKETMRKAKKQIIELFDKFIESYDYLLQHKNSWEIQNNQIVFSNSTHLREYNKIIQEIQTKARLMALTR